MHDRVGTGDGALGGGRHVTGEHGEAGGRGRRDADRRARVHAADEVERRDGDVVDHRVERPLRLLAGTEGIILDPVYSAKAMAGLIDHVRQGPIGKGQTVVFVHTGGTPALFAYAADLDLTPPAVA